MREKKVGFWASVLPEMGLAPDLRGKKEEGRSSADMADAEGGKEEADALTGSTTATDRPADKKEGKRGKEAPCLCEEEGTLRRRADRRNRSPNSERGKKKRGLLGGEKRGWPLPNPSGDKGKEEEIC